MNDSINARLKSAIGGEVKAPLTEDKADSAVTPEIQTDSEKSKVVTTAEELEGYNIIKAILRQRVAVSRIVARDTQSYFGILLDDNNRKPIARLHFNAKQKYIGLFDADKNETRHPIESVDDIFV